MMNHTNAPTAKCYLTVDTILDTIGVVNGTIHATKTSVRISTKYHPIAQRIEVLGRLVDARVLSTVTGDGLYVVSLKGLKATR
jgi:hypothetical protein